MRTLWDDPDDEWSRLSQKIREFQAEHQNEVMLGQLSPEAYAERTGRFNELQRVLDAIRQIRRGEDVAPRRYERVPHVEE
jgi:hypothetical protein